MVLAVVAALALTGCGASPLTGAVKASTHNCADIFATAMVSRTPVKGVWNCLGPDIQAQFRAVGIEGDAGVAQMAAKDPAYSRSKFLGRLSDGAYVYALSGSAGASVLLLWLDGSGRITDIQSGGRSQQR